MRAQASLEYLMTYGWAMIAIVTVIGGLFYFDVFDATDTVPEQCIATPGFGCAEYKVESFSDGTARVYLGIQNNQGVTVKDLNLTAVTSEGSFSCENISRLENGKKQIITCQGTGQIDDLEKIEIEGSYLPDDKLYARDVSFTVSARVEQKAPECTDTCKSLDLACGYHDVCGVQKNCGNCGSGESCNAGVCECSQVCIPDVLCGSHNFCGNNVDCGGCGLGHTCKGGTCVVETPSFCPNEVWEPPTEECDGSDRPSCIVLGYDSGSTTCNPDCTIDDSNCCDDACPTQGEQFCDAGTLKFCFPGPSGCLEGLGDFGPCP